MGIDFRHSAPPTEGHRLAEIMGAGVAVFDSDGDGLQDILFTGAPPEGPRLYRRTAGGTYLAATRAAGLVSAGYGMGVALGDIDNDGDLDVYFTHVGPDQLYRNDGEGTFSDITPASGIVADGWSSSAAFCDVDADGLLDLYVGSYVRADSDTRCTTPGGVPDYCPPNVYPGASDRLYRNLGGGVFEDIGVSSGIANTSSSALGVVCHDFNLDDRADVFVANDGAANHLWINQGDGSFAERGIEIGVAANLFGEFEAGMGIALADLNDDLRMDLFLTHVDRESNTLYLSGPNEVMLDATIRSNLGWMSLPMTGFGTAFLDFDLDGDLDLAIANGRVRRPTRTLEAAASFESTYGEENLLLANDGNGRFEKDCDANPFCADRSVGRGLLAADLDRDGDLDLVVANANGRARVYENRAPRMGNWLAVRSLIGARDAIGGVVQLQIGERRLVRPIVHSRSYLSSRDATVHFGIGEATQIGALVVRWPSGDREAFAVPGINRHLVLVRGEGLPP
ncbi:MAG: CRTAC1 family protein [Acidobacteriota bacterium]|nr:CRTAC1 family protein [Acidobacteriota bacterium]